MEGSKMSLKEKLLKIAQLDAVKGQLTEEEVAELEKLDDSKPENAEWEKKVKESNAKAARILEEKKKIADKYDELAKQLDDIKSSGLSEAEKVQEDIKKAQENNAKLEKELADTKAQYQRQGREYRLEKIAKKIKFLESVPEDMKKMSIEASFSSVENLDDETQVNETLKSFIEAHKGVIESDSPKGSDSQNKRLGQPLSKKEPGDMSYEERAAALKSEKESRTRI